MTGSGPLFLFGTLPLGTCGAHVCWFIRPQGQGIKLDYTCQIFIYARMHPRHSPHVQYLICCRWNPGGTLYRYYSDKNKGGSQICKGAHFAGGTNLEMYFIFLFVFDKKYPSYSSFGSLKWYKHLLNKNNVIDSSIIYSAGQPSYQSILNR